MLAKYRKFADRTSVNVAAALTLMAGPYDMTGHQIIGIEVTNPSGVDTLDCQLETATSSSGPWSVIPTDSWKTITPGETRNQTRDKMARSFMRLRGQSLGATINSVIVSVHAESL